MSIDDLMIGHSFFMAEDKEKLLAKVEYEIILLINEYINDGIPRCKEYSKGICFHGSFDSYRRSGARRPG